MPAVKVLARSVTMVCPTISIAWSARPFASTKLLAGEHGGAGAVGGGGALQPGERRVHHLGVEDLQEGVDVLELGVGVVGRVAVVFLADLGEVLRRGAVLLHVFPAGRAEHVGRRRHDELVQFGQRHHVLHQRLLAVLRADLQRAFFHLLEAHRHHAVGAAPSDRLGAQVQGGRPGGAVVVDVGDRDAGHAQLADGPFTAGGVAVHVADVHLLDPVVADAGVLKRFGSRLLHHLRVVPALAGSGLLKLGHPDADHEDPLVVLAHVLFPLARR